MTPFPAGPRKGPERERAADEQIIEMGQGSGMAEAALIAHQESLLWTKAKSMISDLNHSGRALALPYNTTYPGASRHSRGHSHGLSPLRQGLQTVLEFCPGSLRGRSRCQLGDVPAHRRKGSTPEGWKDNASDRKKMANQGPDQPFLGPCKLDG